MPWTYQRHPKILLDFFIEVRIIILMLTRKMKKTIPETKEQPERCTTCNRPLAHGHVNGNHVRGDKDQYCDTCFRHN
jgi:hypothetical protein